MYYTLIVAIINGYSSGSHLILIFVDFKNFMRYVMRLEEVLMGFNWQLNAKQLLLIKYNEIVLN